jgi:hypothetical protein
MFKQARPSLSLCWLAACVAVAGLAQAPVGSLDGTVHDPTGGVMQGVAVTVTNKDTGQERQAITAIDGAFSAPSLPAGTYSIRAAASGFRTLLQNATVQVGHSTTLHLVMEVERLTRRSASRGKPRRSITTATLSPASSRATGSRTCR